MPEAWKEKVEPSESLAPGLLVGGQPSSNYRPARLAKQFYFYFILFLLLSVLPHAHSSVRLVIWPRPALLLKTLCSPPKGVLRESEILLKLQYACCVNGRLHERKCSCKTFQPVKPSS